MTESFIANATLFGNWFLTLVNRSWLVWPIRNLWEALQRVFKKTILWYVYPNMCKTKLDTKTDLSDSLVASELTSLVYRPWHYLEAIMMSTLLWFDFGMAYGFPKRDLNIIVTTEYSVIVTYIIVSRLRLICFFRGLQADNRGKLVYVCFHRCFWQLFLGLFTSQFVTFPVLSFSVELVIFSTSANFAPGFVLAANGQQSRCYFSSLTLTLDGRCQRQWCGPTRN